MLDQFKNSELTKNNASKVLGGQGGFDLYDRLACRRLASDLKDAQDRGDAAEVARIQALMAKLGC